MNKGAKTWPRIAAASIIAVAIGVAWALVLLWAGYMAMVSFGGNGAIYESMQVLEDGTPVIQTTTTRPIYDTTYRALDGRPISIGQRGWLVGGNYQKPLVPPGVVEHPVGWNVRIARDSNFQRPLVYWFVIRDERPIGSAYLVGYDALSKLPVGYIGRKGFHRTIPADYERFDVVRHTLEWSGSGAVFSSGEGRFGRITDAADFQDQRVPPWFVFIVDGKRLQEVDLRSRSVRTLMESPDMLAGALVGEPLAATPKTAAAAGGAAPNENAREQVISRIMIRKTDRIIVLDRPTGAKREFILPQEFRTRAFVAYTVGADQILITRWNDDSHEEELMWVHNDGSIARRESVVLALAAEPSPKQVCWMAAGLIPAPIAWLSAFGIGPIGMLQSNVTSSYGEGVAKFFEYGCLPLLAVLIAGAALAWLTYRLQRKYRRPATGVWAAFVFLFGLPGFIAYLVEQRRAKLETCPQCGDIVPRDRDACAACNTQFAPPPRVGTEIFA